MAAMVSLVGVFIHALEIRLDPGSLKAMCPSGLVPMASVLEMRLDLDWLQAIWLSGPNQEVLIRSKHLL